MLGLSVVAIPFAAWCAARDPGDHWAPLRKLLGFPPFLALVAAMLLRGTAFPPEVTAVLDGLGAALAPVAFFAVGAMLRLDGITGMAGELAAGLGFKLLLGPALAAGMLLHGFGQGGTGAQVAILQTAMGPSVSAAVVAAELGLNNRMAALMLGIGLPLSLATVVAWALLLPHL